MATTLCDPGGGGARGRGSLGLKVLTKQRPEIIRDRNAMILPRALESNGDGLMLFIDIGQRHPQQAVATVGVAPVTNALAGAAQQRQDRLIAPRHGGRDQAFNEERIESSRQSSGHAAAKLSPPLARRVDHDR